MARSDKHTRLALCECGNVSFELHGAPIMSAACYCSSCQQANQQLQAMDNAPVVAELDGGTHFLLHRKDRIDCLRGQALLREHRLTPASTTRRVVATCCHSVMFLEFANSHWLSIYQHRLTEVDQQPLDIRTMTMDRRPDVEFDDGIPSPEKHNIWFMWKLLSAWIAMGFKAPKIEYVRGEIDG